MKKVLSNKAGGAHPKGGRPRVFAPVMDYPEQMKVFDLSKGYDEKYIRSFDWGIGKYNEKRKNMYEAPQFESKPALLRRLADSGGRRNIHMAIDIWTKAGSAVNAFYDGTIAYFQNNDRKGDYGPTIVTKHVIDDSILYALFGHLSLQSLENVEAGKTVKRGEKIAEIGKKEVNGGWAPHLHFQLSTKDPGKADMPGVVAEEDREEALKIYPDPRIVLGRLYSSGFCF